MVDSINSNRLNHFNWERKISKEKRLEAQDESKKLNEHLEQNLFGKDNLENAANEEKHNEFIQNVDRFAMKQSFNSSVATDILQINKFVAKYAVETNTEQLLEFFDAEDLSENEIDRFSQEMLECEEAIFAEKLDFYITSKKLSVAHIYLLLNFLYSRLKQKQKQFKLALVFTLLKELEQQNSAYLLEFFKLTQHPLIKGDTKLASAFADLSGGMVSVKTIRQLLSFVRDNLSGNYANLVSKAIQLRMGAINRLKEGNKNPEMKTELIEIMSFEKNLILLNTIYKKLIIFKKYIEENKQILITNDCCQAIEAILGVCEASMITDMTMRSFWKQFLAGIVSSFTDDSILCFVRFFQDLPDTVFNNAAQHLKVVEGLRKLLINNSSKVDTKKFAFIRDKQTNKKQYI